MSYIYEPSCQFTSWPLVPCWIFMAFEGDNLKQWRSTQAHSNWSCASQGKTSLFFPYFGVLPVQLKQLTHLLNLFTLWQKFITLLHLYKQNKCQLKYNESLCSVKCGKSIYSFICSFIQWFVCTYYSILVQGIYYSSKYKVTDAQLLRLVIILDITVTDFA